MSQWKFETDPSAFFVGHVVDEKGQSIANVAQGAKQYGAFLAASPTIARALLSAEVVVEELCQGQDPANQCWVTLQEVRNAIEVSGARKVYNMLEDQRIEAILAASGGTNAL